MKDDKSINTVATKSLETELQKLVYSMLLKHIRIKQKLVNSILV